MQAMEEVKGRKNPEPNKKTTQKKDLIGKYIKTISSGDLSDETKPAYVFKSALIELLGDTSKHSMDLVQFIALKLQNIANTGTEDELMETIRVSNGVMRQEKEERNHEYTSDNLKTFSRQVNRSSWAQNIEGLEASYNDNTGNMILEFGCPRHECYVVITCNKSALYEVYTRPWTRSEEYVDSSTLDWT
jgi:hypothetical protein